MVDFFFFCETVNGIKIFLRAYNNKLHQTAWSGSLDKTCGRTDTSLLHTPHLWTSCNHSAFLKANCNARSGCFYRKHVLHYHREIIVSDNYMPLRVGSNNLNSKCNKRLCQLRCVSASVRKVRPAPFSNTARDNVTQTALHCTKNCKTRQQQRRERRCLSSHETARLKQSCELSDKIMSLHHLTCTMTWPVSESP